MADVRALKERAKELRCLYAVDSVLADRQQTPPRVFERALEALPQGWQRPAATGAAIEYLGHQYVGEGFDPDGEMISQPLCVWSVELGRVSVSVSAPVSLEEEPFLPDELELLRRVGGRLSEFLEWKHSEMLGERAVRTRNHWSWRQRFAEALADAVDPERFSVSRMYIGGSTARGDAGPGSDIDLYIESHGSKEQRRDLEMWIEGWSLCLGVVAHQHTGQPFPDGILNIQWLEEPPGVWQQPELQELALGTSKKAH